MRVSRYVSTATPPPRLLCSGDDSCSVAAAGVEELLLSKLGPPPMGAAQWGAGRWLSCYWPTRGYIYTVSTLYIYTVSTLYIYASHGRYIDVYLELGGWGHWARGSGADCLWCPIVNINTAASSSSWGGAAEGCRHPGLSQHYTTHTADADGALMRG